MSALSKAAPNPPSTGHPTDAQLHGVTANLSHPMADRPPRTLGDLLAASVNAFARAPAILAPNRDPLTYMDLGRQLSGAARALAEAGYGGRSRIGVTLPPGAECAVAVLAVCANAVCAPLNPELDEATLRRLLVAMRIDALIVPQGEDSPIVRAARRAGVALVGVRFDTKSLAGTLALIPEERRQPAALTAPQVDDVALLTHTSGTTSTPKIVPLTHRVMAESAYAYRDPWLDAARSWNGGRAASQRRGHPAQFAAATAARRLCRLSPRARSRAPRRVAATRFANPLLDVGRDAHGDPRGTRTP